MIMKNLLNSIPQSLERVFENCNKIKISTLDVIFNFVNVSYLVVVKEVALSTNNFRAMSKG